MAVAPATANTSANVKKIQAMGQPMLAITRVLARGAGMPVIPYKPTSIQDIHAYYTSLLTMPGGGPGQYRFEVTDATGSDVDTWEVRLGPQQMEDIMPGPTTPVNGVDTSGAAANVANANIAAAGNIPLGHGFWYNESLGLLTTPNRKLIRWRPTEPLPAFEEVPLPAPAASTTALPTWPAPFMAPAPAGETPEMRELRAQVERQREERDREREDRRERESAEARAAAAREREELRRDFERMSEDTNKRFEALIATLKPTGPSESERALREEILALRAAQDATRREDAFRAELRAVSDRTEAAIREAKESRTDPMVPLFTTMMQQQTQATQAIVSVMQTSSQQQAQTAESSLRTLSERLGGSVMTPERMMDMIKAAKDRGPEAAATQGMIDMFKSTFNMAQEVVRMQAEIHSAGGAPAWVAPVENAANQVASVAKAWVAQKSATEQRHAQQQLEIERIKAQVRLAEANATMEAARAHARVGGVTVGGQPMIAPQQAAPQELTAEQERAQAAAKIFARPATPVAAASAAAPTAPAAPAPVATPALAVTAPSADAAPEEEEEAGDVTMTPDQMREFITEKYPTDEQFFGGALTHIQKLRSDVNAGVTTPADAANFVATAVNWFHANPEPPPPPAMWVLEQNHIEPMIERLLPGAGPDADKYRRAVADQFRILLRQAEVEGDAA